MGEMGTGNSWRLSLHEGDFPAPGAGREPEPHAFRLHSRSQSSGWEVTTAVTMDSHPASGDRCPVI